MKYYPLFGMILLHATRTIGSWHVGVRNMHDLVFGNFMHPHCLFVLKTLLVLGASPVFLNGGKPNLSPIDPRASCWNLSSCARSSSVACMRIEAWATVLNLVFNLLFVNWSACCNILSDSLLFEVLLTISNPFEFPMPTHAVGPMRLRLSPETTPTYCPTFVSNGQSALQQRLPATEELIGLL